VVRAEHPWPRVWDPVVGRGLHGGRVLVREGLGAGALTRVALGEEPVVHRVGRVEVELLARVGRVGAGGMLGLLGEGCHLPGVAG